MSRTGEIAITWGDGEHTFRLALGQLRELQEVTDAGPAELASRLGAGRWRVDDLREVLRLGLIGGGLEPVKALRLVQRYFDDRPLLESVPTAQAILLAALVGPPDDPVGKPEAAEAGTEAEATASPSPRSTAPGPSSGSRRRRSTG